MTVVDWYLIRHAPVRAAQEKLYQSADEPADLSDTANLDRLCGHLPQGAQWFSSPLARARTTAEALAARMEVRPEITTDDRLREQDFGDWFGLSFADLWREIKDLPPHNWSILAADSRPPGGESFLSVWNRVGGFIDHFNAVENKKSRIIVSHAGVIRAMIGHILAMSPDRALGFALDPLSLTHLQYSDRDYRGGQWRLVKMNETFGE